MAVAKIRNGLDPWHQLPSQVSSGNFGGDLRGMVLWNLDMDIARNLQWTKCVTTALSLQMLGIFNHVQLVGPTLSLQCPESFGVPRTQLSPPGVLELGLDVDF
jgi:hypothetical protein